MLTKANGARSLLLLFWSCVLVILSFVFGAIPLNAFYRQVGGWLYWLFTLALCCFFWGVGYYPMSLSLLSLVISVGFFALLRERKQKSGLSAVISVVITTGVFSALFWAWKKHLSGDWVAYLTEKIDSFITANSLLSEETLKAMDVHNIIYQVPSIFVVLMLLSLALVVITEPKILPFWAPQGESRRRENYLAFSVPEGMIWFFIASLLGAFYNHNILALKYVSLNVFNVLMFVYSLQGYAVIVSYMKAYRVGRLAQALLLFVFIFQLYYFVCGLGILEYWASFRKKLKLKRKKQIERSHL